MQLAADDSSKSCTSEHKQKKDRGLSVRAVLILFIKLKYKPGCT